MATTYKLLLCGRNQLVIDEFYEHMESGYDLLTASPRFRDLVRHVEVFVPDMVIYCLYNETNDDYRKAIELQRHLKKVGAAFAIVGGADDCKEFQDNTNMAADMILAKPLKYDVMRGNIYAFMLDRDREREAQGISKPAAGGIQSVPGMAPAPAPEPPRRKHILVIDDDPLMLKLLKEYLHENYDIATAVSGKIAYKFLESKSTDMVLLDYEMPGESGPEVFLNLRTRPALKDVPIVFLTGVTDAERVKEVLALQPQGYLLKPIDKEKLMTKVKSILH